MVQTIKKTAPFLLLLMMAIIACKKEETNTVVGTLPFLGVTDSSRHIMLTSVRLHEYLFEDTKGRKWDQADGPDIFFVIKKGQQTLVTSDVVYNVPSIAFRDGAKDTLPAVWRFTRPLEFKNYAKDSGTYWIYFYDKDDTGNQFMFKEYFHLKRFLRDIGFSGAGYDANGVFQSKISFDIGHKLY